MQHFSKKGNQTDHIVTIIKLQKKLDL